MTLHYEAGALARALDPARQERTACPSREVLPTYDLLRDLRARGLELELREDGLHVRGPSGALDGERALLLREREGDLVRYLSHAQPRAAGESADPDQGRARRYAPLTPVQQRVWQLERTERASSALLVRTIRLRGEIDEGRVVAALKTLAQVHDALRTGVVERGGRYWLELRDETEFELRWLDGSVRSDPAVQRWAHGPFPRPARSLFRVLIKRLTEREVELSLLVHRALCDEHSMTLMVEYLAALLAGRRLSAPSLRLVDYAAQECATVDGHDLTPELARIRRRLSGAVPLNLPFARARSASRCCQVEARALAVPPELVASLGTLAGSVGSSLDSVFLAAYQLLLAWVGQQTDVIVGMTVARPVDALRGAIGPYANTVVLRTDLSGDPQFVELVRRARDSQTIALEQRELPFESVREAIGPLQRRKSSLVRALFSWDEAPRPTSLAPELSLAVLPERPSCWEAELALRLEHDDGTVHVRLEYDAELFDARTIAALSDRYRRILARAADAHDRPLSTFVEGDDEPLCRAGARMRAR